MGPFLGCAVAHVAAVHQAAWPPLITAVSPLIAMLIAARFHNERLTWRTGGSVFAIAGIVVLFRR
jgi:drug/metabolite transporter (DMT)-like permease